MMREVLEDQFGPLDPALKKRIEEMSLSDLARLRKNIFSVQSLADLGLGH
jgi:hypothetical protein